MIHYFKKHDPRIGVVLSDGSKVMFKAVTRETGVLATDNDGLAGELDKCIAQGRGGMTRITAEEFNELMEKKTPDPLKKHWREEWSNATNKFEMPASLLHASPAAGDQSAPAPMATPAPHAPPVPMNTARPVATKRP